MATEATTQATTEQTTNAEKGKVTFTPEQQEKIQEIINSRMGAAGAEARREAEQAKARASELEAENARLKAEQTTKTQTSGKQSDIEALQAKIAEMESVGKNTKSEVERLNRLLADKEKEVQRFQGETLNVKKTVAIQNAASKANFVNVDVVTKLTADQVKWDEGRGRWVVLNEAGQERMNAAYEPMGLDEFYTEFAAKNPYLVRSGAQGGTGSTESQQRQGLTNNGKYTIEQLFGPKSDSKLANDLAKSDPKEYKRLKGVAREAGLISW